MLVSVLRVTNYHIIILLVSLHHHLSLFTLMFGVLLCPLLGVKYYVSFIDDYSRYCWIYLLKHKSDVESIFYTFQNHVERLLNANIHSVQSDWG